MSKQHTPDVDPGAVRNFSPMKPPTYAEAFGYILQTPRRPAVLLEFFAPEDHANALAVLDELLSLGAVVWHDDKRDGHGLYTLPSKRSAS